jgi:hypothetical protein
MYTARKIETVKNAPGTWRSTKIGVFKDSEQIGEFLRNYEAYGETTFAPFKRDGKWYALYSPIYDRIGVMSLPDCKPVDMIDQEHGFCPVEIYIPEYQWFLKEKKPEDQLHKYPECNWVWLRKDLEEKEYDPDLFNKNMNSDYKYVDVEKETFYEDFAFVSGCFWGDDSSWKIELYDISKAHLGIVKKVPEWGYYELPNLPLKECVKLYGFKRDMGETHNAMNVQITITKTIGLVQEGDIKLKFYED